MKYTRLFIATLFCSLLSLGFSVVIAQNGSAIPQFTADEYKAHVAFLAGDLLEGRSPGTRGCDLAAQYIAAQFQAVGLQPIPDSKSYFQPVPLKRTLVNPDAVITINKGDQSVRLSAPDQIVMASELDAEKIAAEGELCFVGYGIDAPEYGVNDFKGVDVKGKILVALRGAPDHAKANLPGKDRTVFGKTDFKLETARSKGAKGVLFLLEKGQERFFDGVKEESRVEAIRENFFDGNRLAVTGWISKEAADSALALIGSTFEEFKARADRPGFQAQSLNANISVTMTQSVRRFDSPNVAGFLPGSAGNGETVVFAAHYDGLGIGPPDKNGDRIYNGAADNAAGTSAMIVLARAFKNMSRPPERNIVFLATTAEESGALGSRYYTERPLKPLDKTVVLINIDGINRYGLYDDFIAMAVTATDARDALNKIAEPLSMSMSLSQDFEENMYYSFDTESFSARGVPGFTIWQGFRMRGKTPQETFEYTRQFFGRHHNPSDEFKADWNDEGAVQHLQLYYLIGHYYASGGAPPKMKPRNPYTPLERLRKRE